MAYTIISESYGPRKPKIICTADSLDDLAGLDCAEGSEATVGGTRYVLDRVNGWVEPGGGGGVFIVNLTPTAQDYSGTMDKTVAEINAAYEAGQKIVFRVYTSATTYVEVDCTMIGVDKIAGDYPTFNAYVIKEQNSVLIYAYTGTSASASSNSYFTKVYHLTPMS